MNKSDNLSFLRDIIREAIDEMGFNSKGKQNGVDDELEDLEDEYSVNDLPSNNGKQVNTGRGSAFNHKNNPGVIKHISDAALERKRKGLPYSNDYLGAEWSKVQGAVQKDVLNPDKYGRIKVMVSSPLKVKSYEFPIMVVTLLNIDINDCKELKTNFQGIGHTERVNIAKTREGVESAGVSFIISESHMKMWIEDDLEKVIDFLGNIKGEDGKSKYFATDEEKQNIRDYVINRSVSSSEFGEMITTSHNNNIEMFNAFIAAENDSEVQDFINIYQRFGLVNQLCNEAGLPVSFGKILSVQNASLVLGSGRLSGAGVRPTFILTENMWYKMFKRRVKPSGRPFYIFVPSNRYDVNKKKEQNFTSKPYMLKDKNGQEVEISSTSDVLNILYFGKKWDELTSQQKIAASQMCNYINPSKCFPMAEFDVSDTEPIDPNDDVFEKEIGLSNRFTGELNQAAMNFVKQQGLMDSENKNDEDSNDENSEEGSMDAFKMMGDKINSIALKNLTEYCKEENINFTLDEHDVSKSIINALHNIAIRHIPLRKQENIEILAGDAVYMTCVLHKVALDLVKSIKRGKTNNNQEASQCIDAFVTLSMAIEGTWKHSDSDSEKMSMVSENINEDDNLIKKYTPQQLRAYAMKMLGLNESIYNAYTNFNLLMERMDNSKNNLK